MKNLVILIIVLIGAGINAFAQEKSNKELRGDKQYFVYSFDKATYTYTHVKKLSVEGQRRLAESYYNLEQNIKSEKAYSTLVSFTVGVLPEDYYNYSRILKINGKNAESNVAMDKFVELKPNDLRGNDYIRNKNEFGNLSKDNGKWTIIQQTVNTDAEDFAPSYYKDKVVFASSRSKPKMIVKKNNWTGNAYYDLYISEIEDGQLKNPEAFDKGINGKMHDGPASFSKDGNFMAFTRNHYDLNKKAKVVELGIHFSSYVNGKWSEPEAFYLNSKDYSVGHPSLTSDGKTMYFTSDKSNGYGGADIYSVTRGEDGKWGNLENMGDKINTEGDEIFPFFEENSQSLFFSSNGRFGLGGLDIFICNIKSLVNESAYNAGYPLNTPFDDFGAIVNDKRNKGYFTSNRNKGSGSDDIYAFDFLEIIEVQKEIQGITEDNNGNLLPTTFVTLMDENDNILDTITTKANASFSFKAGPNKKYKLSGEKEKHYQGNSTANTFGEEAIIITNVVLIKKEEIIEPEVIDVKLPELKNIYFDFGKSNLRPEAVIELNKLVKLMNDNPNMVVVLHGHTDCRASDLFNQKLSARRAKVPVWYVKTRISNSDRITGKGYGESELVNKCLCKNEGSSGCSEAEHQNNRRTETIIISNNKTKILP